jgi:hypothetical protein
MNQEQELLQLIESHLQNVCEVNLPRLCELCRTEEGKETVLQTIFSYCKRNGTSVQAAMAHIDTEL